ncbi:hypothetical protein O181_103933 [Austropuccinia psidii MF-1]|uniref:Reverse transcriptase Ty1/copia-type domain-containing protein n=1 Tax=Austropuccinia psidii MF-1 TaxID=1389203 RepID=A0A9Q3JJ74_9BASI|nr:hypothetical protein [Austropuccinia psidii MF-1]
MFLHIHVENGFIEGEYGSVIERFLKQLNKSYSIKAKKKLAQHLGYILSWKPNRSIIIHQLDFCTKILDELNIISSNSIKTPSEANIHKFVEQTSAPFSKYMIQKAIGMLNYHPLHTQPDIMFTTNLLSQFISKTMTSHWNLAKPLLK